MWSGNMLSWTMWEGACAVRPQRGADQDGAALQLCDHVFLKLRFRLGSPSKGVEQAREGVAPLAIYGQSSSIAAVHGKHRWSRWQPGEGLLVEARFNYICTEESPVPASMPTHGACAALATEAIYAIGPLS